MRAKTGRRIFAEKLSLIFWMGEDMGYALVLGQSFHTEGKFDFKFAGFGHDDLLEFGGDALMPCFQFVCAGGNVWNTKAPRPISGGKKRILQDEQDATHLRVNGAEDIDATRGVELYLL